MNKHIFSLSLLIWAITPLAHSQTTLSTPFSGGNGQSGNIFDANVLNPAGITLQGLEVSLDPGTYAMELYTRPGTSVGFQSNAAGWILRESFPAVTSAGNNIPTGLTIANFFLPLGVSGFYVTVSDGGTSLNYTNGTAVGNILAADANLQILAGYGKAYPFAGTFTTRNWNGSFIYSVGAVAPVAALAPATRRRQVTPTILVTDIGAIYSTMTSGLGMGLVNQQITQSAPNAALNDLNNRLFRARSGLESAPQAFTSTIGGDSSLLRHLAFVQDENMSYKVALGLADPEERTVEVNVADTLSAQTGNDFNGQSLGGGLPYAMMGVPLMPMAGGAATVHIVEAAPSGKTVIDDSKAAVEIAPRNQWELFVAGDFSSYDQDQLTNLMQGFDTTTYAGTVGLEYRIKEWLNLGLAWSYLQSDANVSGNYGNIDLEGNLISGYATVFWKQYWVDTLYSYGSFNNDISRNTGLGSRARGDTDSQSHNIRLNFGRNFNVGNNITTGPIAGLRYSNGDVDPYSERGGGSAALDYNGTDFESMVSRLGWQATHVRPTGWGRLVSQVRLSWEREFMPENGTVGAGLQTSPFALVTGNNVRRFGGFSAEEDGAHPGTDWLSAGAGLRFELSNGVAFLTDYQGAFFRNNASQHYVSAKLSYEWGAFMPKGGSKGDAGSGKAVDYEAYEASLASESVISVAETASNSEAEVAVVEKKNPAGTFASWLRSKGR